MAFKKAKREQIWLKILLTGPSGAGKSYSALRLATGLAKATGSDVAYIGTEGPRDKYYADEFDYDLMQLDKDGNARDFTDYSPESYIHNIEEAIKAGYKVLIIDSLTPEWTFINEVHDAMKGNSFQNWGKVKPRHTKMVEYIMASPIHIVCCARGKDSWILEEQNGKQVPRKVGLGGQTDKDMSYNMTVSFLLNDQDRHTYEADKDNTHLFEGIYGKQLTEKDGEALYNWANSSDIPATAKNTKKYTEAVIDDSEKIATMQKSVIELVVSLGGTKNAEAMKVLKSYTKTGNPNQIKTLAELEEAYQKLNAVKPVTEEKNE